ncbi:serine/threonine protein kinase [Murinocardiopsis flavida]|uniref:Serine/threonine protein kinase n=1 Tax=Murinocardiopsis flavida TaxID=645275 RepID=A0A2P8CVI1_9ACTN|nr:serine/threonine-protein kinase [Murinocardiopsis flavida]PSK88978.1 serine/threonine protein kinase [Murinocardiopsis flavida]
MTAHIPLRPGDPSEVGPYLLHARLGDGAMGRVYLGRSPDGRTAAVKVVHPDLAEDPVFRRHFADEVEAARRVGGPCTAHVVDADTAADPSWLATAYIPGPTLREAVHEHGPLPADSAAALGAGLAEGLMAVHAGGVVHRDLKPGNVILTADGPRLIEFGIAGALDSTSRARTGVGTAGFMAPELATGAPVGPPADVFSLGCLLAYATTGRSPFGQGSAHASTYRIGHAPDLTGVPAALADPIADCLANDPGARPSPEALVERLATTAAPGAGRGSGQWLPEPLTEFITHHATTAQALTETRPRQAHPEQHIRTAYQPAPGVDGPVPRVDGPLPEAGPDARTAYQPAPMMDRPLPQAGPDTRRTARAGIALLATATAAVLLFVVLAVTNTSVAGLVARWSSGSADLGLWDCAAPVDGSLVKVPCGTAVAEYRVTAWIDPGLARLPDARTACADEVSHWTPSEDRAVKLNNRVSCLEPID